MFALAFPSLGAPWQNWAFFLFNMRCSAKTGPNAIASGSTGTATNAAASFSLRFMSLHKLHQDFALPLFLSPGAGWVEGLGHTARGAPAFLNVPGECGLDGHTVSSIGVARARRCVCGRKTFSSKRRFQSTPHFSFDSWARR